MSSREEEKRKSADKNTKPGILDSLSLSFNGVSSLASDCIGAAGEGIARVSKEIRHRVNTDPRKAAGFVSEAYHVASYGVDAAFKGVKSAAKMTSDLGRPADPVDVIITSGSETLTSQLKQTTSDSMATIARRAGDPKYAHVDSILMPSDKLQPVKNYAAGRLQKPKLSGRRMLSEKGLNQILDKGTDHLDFAGAQSKPLTSKEAVEMASSESSAAKNLKGQAAKRVLGMSLGVGVFAGALTMAASKKNNFKDKAIEGGKAAAFGAGGALLTTGAVVGLKQIAAAKGFSLLRPLAKGNVAANVVDAGVTILHQGYKLYKGEIDGRQMADACAEKGSGMLCAAGGAGAGATLAVALALPTGGASLVVGGVSVVGGIAGPKLYKLGKGTFLNLVNPKTNGAIELKKISDQLDELSKRISEKPI